MRILLRLEGSLSLPIAHHDALQKAFYSLLDGEMVAKWHKDTHTPRPYTFSRLLGKAKVFGKSIEFQDGCLWWISSVDSSLLMTAVKNLMDVGQMKIANQIMILNGIEWEPSPVFSSSITVETLSPIVADDNVSGKIISYAPHEDAFISHIQSSSNRKVKHFLGSTEDIQLEIQPIRVQKVVTWFKSTPVVGYSGQFKLEAAPLVLRLLYDVGIGRRNGLGFGCFRWLA